MAELALVDPPEIIYRVARVESGLRFSEITPEDSASGTSGNRYDVAGGGVLYAATEVRTCFAETLARFRPSPKIRSLLKEADPAEAHFMVCGGVPQDWRLRRRIFELEAGAALPFVDVEDPGTLTILERELCSQLMSLGYAENLDLADLRNKDRRLSRSIAEWVYVAQDADGSPLYSGIRYCSRVDASKECWAIFDGTPVVERTRRSIELVDPDLETIAKLWDIRPF